MLFYGKPDWSICLQLIYGNVYTFLFLHPFLFPFCFQTVSGGVEMEPWTNITTYTHGSQEKIVGKNKMNVNTVW